MDKTRPPLSVRTTTQLDDYEHDKIARCFVLCTVYLGCTVNG